MLNQHLEQELIALTEFIDVLSEESAVLECLTDPEALIQIIGRKVKAAQNLESLYAKRLSLIENSAQGKSQEEYFSQNVGLSGLWNRLAESIQQANVLNQQNGIMIKSYADHNQAALEAVDRAVELGRTDVYDAKGKRALRRTSILAKG